MGRYVGKTLKANMKKSKKDGVEFKKLKDDKHNEHDLRQNTNRYPAPR